MLSEKKIIEQTRCWLQSVVVEFNFCPFAKREFERNTIYYKVVDDEKLSLALECFMTECFRLDAKPEIETSFLIFSNNFIEFDDFLEFVSMSNDILATQQYEGVYQIASFHPDYCFADSLHSDAANFTNRSPFPMLHLLRESSIEQVLQNHPVAENIPLQNITKARKIGNETFRNILAECKKN